MSNPLRSLITEMIFKLGACVVRVERRDADNVSHLVDYLIRRSEYNVPMGWHARTEGLVRESLEGDPTEALFLPYHRVRSLRLGPTRYWSSDDPKTIPQDIPFTLESGR